jgi:hypothetical protein
MTEENLSELMITKFYASPKNKQTELLKMYLQTTSNKDRLIDYLNGKKITDETMNISEKDYIYIDISTSVYPSINKEYYQQNDLIVNDQYIRVYVNHINPVTGYINIRYFTSLTIESTQDVYPGYLTKQTDIIIA